MYLYQFYLYLIITLLIYDIYGQNQFYSSLRPRRLLPADSYTILGQAGLRRLGQCNITYAWLTSPPTSSLDAYGHATACKRLQLFNGEIIPISSNDYLNNNNEDLNQAEKELKYINHEWSASLIDLERLDLLIRAEGISLTESKQLANDPRYFFLANRIGDLNLMAVLRPDKQLKLELINPLASEQLVLTPQHVLCLRKQCPTNINDININITKQDNISIINGMNNVVLTKTIERQNRELYMQLVISRVACALISFMCVVFAMTSLTLCIRLRQNPNYIKKHIIRSSQASICKESQSLSKPFCQLNGKINMNQISPLFITEQSSRHYGITQIPSETASMNNIVMTASNISTYDPHNTIQNIPISYSTFNTQYAHISNYPMNGTSTIPSYNDNSGLITIYPIPSHSSINSNQHSLLFQCQNGSISPAPSNHSDNKNSISHTGSLGRYSHNSVCYGDSTRKKLLYQIKKSHQNSLQTMKQQPNDLNISLSNNRPIPIVQQHPQHPQQPQQAQQPQQPQQLHQSIKHDDNISGKPDDLISFQYTPNFTTIIHRYPTELQYNDMKSIPNIDMEETNSDIIKSNNFNHINEPSINVIRKPAHVN